MMNMQARGENERADESVLKGLAVGLVAGLVAAWTMNQFQAALGKLLADEEQPHGAQSLQQGSPEHGLGRELQERGRDEPDDNAAVRTANAIAELGFNQHLTKDEKEFGGAIAHYAMGATSGAIYGAMAEIMPVATVGVGLPFGAAVWLSADEVVVPLLGLSRPATDYPLPTHIYSFASHLVYGLTTEVVRRTLRRAL
jgi:putative membrane protein